MTRDRIILYRLLAQALAYPDQRFVTRLQEAVGQINLEMLDDQRLPLAAFIQELGQLAALPLDQVQGEHTRLSISAYPSVPCPPYESAYREGELLGQATQAVDALYRQWGLAVEGEAADHAGAELEFVAFLLSLGTAEALAAAAAFATEHLLTWLPSFAADLSRASRLGFYGAVGRLLAAALPGERKPA